MFESSFQNPNPSFVYAAAILFVNLTNSTDKQEMVPEMVELAKYSKQHVPEEHPMVLYYVFSLARNSTLTVLLVTIQRLRVRTPAWLTFFLTFDKCHCDNRHSSSTNGLTVYVEKYPVAWKECCVEYWYEKVRKHTSR